LYGWPKVATRWRFSLIGLLAILPLIQFWHATSFLPARLKTSMSVTSVAIEVRGETESDRQGTFQVQLHNASEVDALVLASRVMWCFDPSNANWKTNMDELYKDPH
jgi:hypothetical protein